MDAAGCLSKLSYNGNQYKLVMYGKDFNLIHAEPLWLRDKHDVMQATERGLKLFASDGKWITSTAAKSRATVQRTLLLQIRHSVVHFRHIKVMESGSKVRICISTSFCIWVDISSVPSLRLLTIQFYFYFDPAATVVVSSVVVMCRSIEMFSPPFIVLL